MEHLERRIIAQTTEERRHRWVRRYAAGIGLLEENCQGEVPRARGRRMREGFGEEPPNPSVDRALMLVRENKDLLVVR